MAKRKRSIYKSGQPKGHGHLWRLTLSWLCIVLGAMVLVPAIATRYVRNNLLNTDQYIKIVGPLPQDPKVAQALATYTTNAIFNATNAQNRIEDLLPTKLAPLATPLTDSLEKRVNQAAFNFISSDKFEAVWTSSNLLSHKAVMRVAESQPKEDGKLKALMSLNLQGLVNAVANQFGAQESQDLVNAKTKTSVLVISLRQNVEQLRMVVKAIKSGAQTLPFVALGLFLAAIAVAYNRNRAVSGIGFAMVIVASAALLTFKITWQQILNSISNDVYAQAANVIYQAFYRNLQSMLVAVMLIGLALTILTLFFGPYAWAVKLRKALGAKAFRKGVIFDWCRFVRKIVAKCNIWLSGGMVILTGVILLTSAKLTVSTLIVSLSLLVAFISIVQIVAKPAPVNR